MRAVEAADPARALRNQLVAHPFPQIGAGGGTILIAIGKAAPAMLAEALKHVHGPHVALAVTHYENTMDVPEATVLRAAHPVPDENGLDAGRRVIDLLSTARASDQVIALISGGGSALVPAPVAGITLQDKAALNQILLGSGLDINTMNLIRQQVSQLKGGGFLRHAAPAPVTAYILSDVIGDDLRAVASGPTVSPIGTPDEARAICIEAKIWQNLPISVREHFDRKTSDDTPILTGTNYLIGSNRQSLSAALSAVSDEFDAAIVSDQLVGDVEAAANTIVQAFEQSPKTQPCALLFGGETTVQIRGTGLGGRNQELALRVARLMKQRDAQVDWAFLSGGTDGRDGPTQAAGGLVDNDTIKSISQAGLNVEDMLANNDSFHALQAADHILTTQATGTNVADIQCLLFKPAEDPHP